MFSPCCFSSGEWEDWLCPSVVSYSGCLQCILPELLQTVPLLITPLNTQFEYTICCWVRPWITDIPTCFHTYHGRAEAPATLVILAISGCASLTSFSSQDYLILKPFSTWGQKLACLCAECITSLLFSPGIFGPKRRWASVWSIKPCVASLLRYHLWASLSSAFLGLSFIVTPLLNMADIACPSNNALCPRTLWSRTNNWF